MQGIKAGPLPSLSACARVVDGGSLADLATSSILAATGPPDGGDVALLVVAHGHAHTGGIQMVFFSSENRSYLGHPFAIFEGRLEFRTLNTERNWGCFNGSLSLMT